MWRFLLRSTFTFVWMAVLSPSLATAEGPAYDEAAAGGWSRTFATLPASGCLSSLPVSLAVVGVGEECEAAEQAAAALARALEKARPGSAMKTQAVMPNACSLYDQAIVEQVEGSTLIVRVFGGRPEARRAAVTLYDRLGRAQTAIIAEEGAPLASCAEAARLEREYERLRLRAAPDSARRVQVHEGLAATPMTLDRFFELTDRPDLLEKYRRNRRSAGMRVIIGLAVAVGGAVLFAATYDSCQVDDTCPTNGWSVLGGVATLLGGSVAVDGATAVNDPTNDEDKLTMVESYNERLRARLSKQARDAMPSKVSASPTWRIAPSLARGGGGALLAVTF